MFKFIFASTLIIASINSISSCSDSNSQQDHQFLLLRSEHEKNVVIIPMMLQQANALEFRMAALKALSKDPSSKYQESDYLTELANIHKESDSLRAQIEFIRLQEKTLRKELKRNKVAPTGDYTFEPMYGSTKHEQPEERLFIFALDSEQHKSS